MTIDEVLAAFNPLLTEKSVGFFTTFKGSHVNIKKLPEGVALEEVLNEGAQFEATAGFFDGSITVIFNCEKAKKPHKFKRVDPLKIVFAAFEADTGVAADEYILTFKGKDYRPQRDDDTQLIELSDEAQLVFQVGEPADERYRITLLLVTDAYETNRKFTVLQLDFPKRPTYEDMVATAQSVRSDFAAHHLYKVNNFDEPVKEIQSKHFKDLGYDIDRVLRLMVKVTPGKMDFQTLKFAVYTPKSFPVDLNKQCDFKIEDEPTVGVFKQRVLERLKDVFPDQDPLKYHFQFLNQFNVPSKYLLQPHSQLKKHCHSTNKLLVRRKDVDLPPGEDFIAVFLRKRNPEQRSYEGYQQVFLPKKFQRVSGQNLAALKEFLVAKLRLDCPLPALGLAVVNYKNFEWTKLEGSQVTLKDGDEIGFLLRNEGNAHDDMQSDELLALALADNRDRYVFNHKFVKETPFSINLED